MQRQPIGGKLRVFFQEGMQEFTLPLTPDTPFIIGRGRDAHLRFPNAPHYSYISNRHCHIVMNNGYYYLADGVPGGKPSTHGTFVNEQRIGQAYQFLQPNDEITLGYGASIVRIQFLVTLLDFAADRGPMYGADNRPTQPRAASSPAPYAPSSPPHLAPPAPGPYPEVDSYGMPITRSHSPTASSGQLPGTNIALALKNSIGGILTVLLLGTIFYGLATWLAREILVEVIYDTNLSGDAFRASVGIVDASLLSITWYVIGCGVSACFPNLTSRTFLPLVGGVAVVTFGSVFIESNEDGIEWAIRAAYAGAIAFPLSRLGQFFAPGDRPKLRLEYAVILFAALIAAHYLVYEEVAQSLVWDVEINSEMEYRARIFTVGAIFGVTVAGLVWGALKSSEQQKR